MIHTEHCIPTDTYYFQELKEHITKRTYIGPLGKLELFQRTVIMQSILRDCNGLTVYVPSNFTPHVVILLGGRDSGRGQVKRGMGSRAARTGRSSRQSRNQEIGLTRPGTCW